MKVNTYLLDMLAGGRRDRLIYSKCAAWKRKVTFRVLILSLPNPLTLDRDESSRSVPTVQIALMFQYLKFEMNEPRFNLL